jgi:hypothetical protein
MITKVGLTKVCQDRDWIYNPIHDLFTEISAL